MADQKETLVGSIAVEGKPVFDDTFELVSFVLGNIGLSAAEVVLMRDGKVYTMEIATRDVEADRSALTDASEPPAQGGEPYIVEGDEILPSELMALKIAPTELLMPHLVEQIQI